MSSSMIACVYLFSTGWQNPMSAIVLNFCALVSEGQKS
jgi:hypothetical protein